MGKGVAIFFILHPLFIKYILSRISLIDPIELSIPARPMRLIS